VFTLEAKLLNAGCCYLLLTCMFLRRMHTYINKHHDGNAEHGVLFTSKLGCRLSPGFGFAEACDVIFEAVFLLTFKDCSLRKRLASQAPRAGRCRGSWSLWCLAQLTTSM